MPYMLKINSSGKFSFPLFLYKIHKSSFPIFEAIQEKGKKVGELWEKMS
jgi:hypothetical protein